MIHRQSTEDVQGSENTPHDIRIMDMHHYTFVQVLECATPKVSSRVNYGLWVIMRSQRRLISGNKCVRDVNYGEGCVCAGAGGTGEISALSSQFCY